MLRRRLAFTLIELVIVVAVIGILAALATPRFNQWMSNQRVRAAARSVADVLALARAEAIRTGNNHVVFFRIQAIGTTDPAGTAVEDAAGDPVPILVIDDGRPATANCLIEAGERRETISAEPDAGWGVSEASARAPLDTGAPPFADGATFADPSSPANAVNWLLFRPDGVPVAFSGNPSECGTLGDTGSGRGTIYVTNGMRDYAVVLTPLGGLRVHAWEPNSGQWTN